MKHDREAAGELARAVLRTSTLLRASVRRALEETGITPREWLLLDELWRTPGDTTHGDLARATGKDKSTVTRLVDGLVAKGLLRREPSRLRPAKIVAKPTQAGLDLKRSVADALSVTLFRLGTRLDERTARATASTLDRLAVELGRR